MPDIFDRFEENSQENETQEINNPFADIEENQEESPNDESQNEANENVNEENSETPKEEDKSEEEKNEQVPFHKNPRFKELVDEKNSLKKEVAELREMINKKSEDTGSQPDEEAPDWFVDLYGDNNDVWKKYSAREKAREEEIEKRAIAKFKAEQQAKDESVKSNEQWIEDQFHELELSGAKFEKNEIFAVIDKFRPIGEDNKYDFKRAYEILELQRKKDASKVIARKKIADDKSSVPDKPNSGFKTPKDFVGGW